MFLKLEHNVSEFFLSLSNALFVICIRRQIPSPWKLMHLCVYIQINMSMLFFCFYRGLSITKYSSMLTVAVSVPGPCLVLGPHPGPVISFN